MELYADMIPAWVVALSLIYAGFIWITTRGTTIRMDSRIWGTTFLLAGLLYLLTYIVEDYGVDRAYELEVRLFFTRLLMLLLSMSQWLPITVSYFRMVRRARTTNRHHSNSSSDSNFH